MKDLFSLSRESLLEQGVVDWGYTQELEPRSYDHYLSWVDQGLAGPLKYLGDGRKLKRKSLKNVFPECESALSFLFDYRSAKKFQIRKKSKFQIAAFTVGFKDQDYHFWIKDKLEFVGESLKKENSSLEFKISLDVHPVLERDLAYRSGLGWFGKNSMLIQRALGSYNIIGSLLINQKLALKKPKLELDHCGHCTRCIDACPTKAISLKERTINSAKCISCFTIETFKDSSPPLGYPSASHDVFGCDICQEVCPWNSKTLSLVSEIQGSELVDFFNRSLGDIYSDIESMSNKGFKTFFKQTSFERVGKKGLLKNLKYYL